MRTSEIDILIVPGLGGSGPDHWQTRWQAKLSTAQRVDQEDWARPQRDQWTARLVAAAAAARRPIVLVAHSLGVVAAVHAAPRLPVHVVGAFLVAPPSEQTLASLTEVDAAFVPVPRDPLPFPAALIASADDPNCSLAAAQDMAAAWGAAFTDAGAAGHLNAESGHGPWPEGLLHFAAFLKRLGPLPA